MILNILGWILWCIALVSAIRLSLGCRKAIKKEGNFHIWLAVAGMLWWAITFIFLFSDINKLHILWLIPLILFGTPILSSTLIIRQLLEIPTRIFITIICFGFPGYVVRVDGRLVKRDFDKEKLIREKWNL